MTANTSSPPHSIQHELLITYVGPLPHHDTNRKTICLTLPQPCVPTIISTLSAHIGIPACMLHLPSLTEHRTNSITLDSSTASSTTTSQTIHQYTLTATLHPHHTILQGGKGGFGTLLKGQSKQAASRQTLDFGACRDLSGRRLRHVNDEIKLRKFASLQKARAEAQEKGETIDEVAALKTESGIRNWHLMVPNWSEVTNKGKRKYERQLEREVEGWKRREEREKDRKEYRRMEEEWAISEYVRRGELEGERVGGDLKGQVLEMLKKKREGRGKNQFHGKSEMDGKDNSFTSSMKTDGIENESNDSPLKHMMTLSGDVSVHDISNSTSIRIQSQSDFATVVILLNPTQLSSHLHNGCKGIYIEYTIQSAGIAQIGWIRSPQDNTDVRFLPNSDTGDGVGDDAVSFGYDGSRGRKFHNGQEISYGSEDGWKKGDVLACWCRLSDDNEKIEMGYTLNGVNFDVAFSWSGTSQDLGRYFPAVSLNLGEILDVRFGSTPANDMLVDVSALLVTKEDDSLSDEGKPKAEVKEGNNDSPPKKKLREDEKQEVTTPSQQEKDVDEVPFDLNSCQSIEDLLDMDPTRLKKILLSMGVKCGGTPRERAERLFSLKGLRRQDYPMKVRGKYFVL